MPKRDLIIYFWGDEETAKATTVAIAQNHRELIDAEFALNADGGGGTLDDDTGKPLYLRPADRREDLRGLLADRAQSRAATARSRATTTPSTNSPPR